MVATSGSVGAVALLADLLLLPTARYGAVAENPRRWKEETFAGLQRRLAGLAQQKPMLLIFEDLHWIDPTTQQLLHLFIRQIEQLPVLPTATFLPEFLASWAGRPPVPMLPLRRLPLHEGDALVRPCAS